MTTYQTQAVWELCREGYPIPADEAEDHWSSGYAYHPHPEMRLSRPLQHLIAKCNYEMRNETGD